MERSGRLQVAQEILLEMGLLGEASGPAASFSRYLQKDASGRLFPQPTTPAVPKTIPDATESREPKIQLSFFDSPDIAS